MSVCDKRCEGCRYKIKPVYKISTEELEGWRDEES